MSTAIISQIQFSFARSYQRLYFRNVLHPIVRPSILGSSEQRKPETSTSLPGFQFPDETTEGIPLSHIFDGIHQTRDTAAYQLCDIVDPMLKAMIEDESGVRDECNVRRCRSRFLGFFET